MSIVSPVSHSTSTFLLVPLFYSSSFDTYYNHPHTSPHSSLLQATSNSSSPTLLSSICLYVLLLAYYDIAGLSLFSALYPLIYISFLPLTLNPPQSATHLFVVLLPLLSKLKMIDLVSIFIFLSLLLILY